MINIRADIKGLLKQTLVAVIKIVDKFGRPRSAPIWFNWGGEVISRRAPDRIVNFPKVWLLI